MKNLFDQEAYREVLARLEKLTPETQRLWGKMDVAQMMAHCALGLEAASGQLKLKRSLMGWLIGGFLRPFYSSDKPFSKGTPTGKEFIMTDPKDFTKEKERLIRIIQSFHKGGPQNCTKEPHSFFGNLTPEEWGKGMYKHLDHHLQQFGV